MRQLPADTRSNVIAIVLLVLLVVSLACNVVFFVEPKRATCADFGSSYTDAQDALNKGAWWLDANHDGIACNALYTKYKKTKRS